MDYKVDIIEVDDTYVTNIATLEIQFIGIKITHKIMVEEDL